MLCLLAALLLVASADEHSEALKAASSSSPGPASPHFVPFSVSLDAASSDDEEAAAPSAAGDDAITAAPSLGSDSVAERNAAAFEQQAEKRRALLLSHGKRLAKWGASLTKLASHLTARQKQKLAEMSKRMQINWAHSDGFKTLGAKPLSPDDVDHEAEGKKRVREDKKRHQRKQKNKKQHAATEASILFALETGSRK